MGLIDRVERAESLQLIGDCETTCRRVWQYPKLLPYFTDHCPLHSERIIALLDEFLGDAAERLHEDEIVTLLCAAWLHDLALQDFGLLQEREENRDVQSPLSLAERALIRREHAARIKALILRRNGSLCVRTGRVELVQLPALGHFRAHIADACYGHSTDGYLFTETLDYRDNRGPLRRMTHDFQGQLLAALLLLADECDLDHGRVDPALSDVGIERMEAIAALHNLKHDCVYGSRIQTARDDPNRRQLLVKYRWPTNHGEYPGFSSDYQTWIETKILTQMNTVRSRVMNGLGVFFEPDCPIRADEAVNPPPPQPVDPRVAALLRSAVKLLRLGNLENESIAIAESVRQMPVTILVGEGTPDELGARELIEASISALHARVLERGSELTVFPVFTETADPLDLILGTMGWEEAQGPEAQKSSALMEAREYEKLVDYLLQELAPEQLKVVAIQSLSDLSQEAARLVTACLIPLAVGANLAVRTVIASEMRPEIEELEGREGIAIHRLPRISRLELHRTLDRFTIIREEIRERFINLCCPGLTDDGFTQEDVLRVVASIGRSP